MKADAYLSRYEQAIASQKDQLIGSFVFLWGQKQERTPTWFGMFMPDGTETEAIDVMHYAWNGEWPANRTPRLNDFTLEGKRAPDNIKLKPGATYAANADVSDPENDALIYRWSIMRETTTNATGGDKEEIPETLEGLVTPGTEGEATLQAPAESGAYRLFIEVTDGNDHNAHANIPFFVEK